MEITPAQLDGMATKLLGWTPTRCPIHGTSCPEAYYHKPDGTQGHGFLDVESPAAAMLVLEAMGKWCADKHQYVLLESEYLKGWTCGVTAIEQSNGERDVLEYEYADTPAGAIFQCATQLAGRM